MSWPKEVQSVLSIGKSLSEYGDNNWGLTKAQALEALDKLQELQIPVAGGDVYRIVNNRPEVTYDNWSCNHTKNETKKSYVLRSINEARNYIKNYKSSEQDILITLVPIEVLETG